MKDTRHTMIMFYLMVEYSLLLAGGLFACAFIYVALSSLGFPFQLEWMEGQSIDVVQRVVDGKPLYTAPTLEYVPLIYPPYYFYASALLSLVTGVDFFAARLVSFLATLGTCTIIYAWLRREEASWKIALAGAFLFLATYRLSGRWFDMSRVDSLFLFLTLAGLYMAVHMRGMANAFCAAALLAAAFFTKQTALMIAAPVLAALMLIDWRHAILVGSLTAIITGLAVGIANHASDGWFGFYMFTLPAAHNIERSMISRFWTEDVFKQVGIFFLFSMLTILYAFFRDWRKGLLYLMMGVGFIGASYASRLHSYGYINVLMPMHAFLALTVGLGLICCNAMQRRYVSLPLAAALILVALSALIYSPSRLIPTPQMLEAGNQLVEKLKSVEGDVFMPEMQFIQTRAGKKSYTLGMAGFDVMRANLGKNNYIKQSLSKQIADAVRLRQFGAVMPGRMIWLPSLSLYYQEDPNSVPPQQFVTGAIRGMPADLYIRGRDWTDGRD